jgi:hypothetical protein
VAVAGGGVVGLAVGAVGDTEAGVPAVAAGDGVAAGPPAASWQAAANVRSNKQTKNGLRACLKGHLLPLIKGEIQRGWSLHRNTELPLLTSPS